MKFEDILPNLKTGQKIRRKAWASFRYIKRLNLINFSIRDEESREKLLQPKDILNDDWEIYAEPVKVKPSTQRENVSCSL